MQGENASLRERFQEIRAKVLSADLGDSISELRLLLAEAEAARDHHLFLKCLNVIGVAYNGLGNDGMALDFFLRGLTFAEEKDIPVYNHFFYNNIGARFQMLEKYDDALKYYVKAEQSLLANEAANEANDSFYVICFLNQSECHRHLGDIFNAERCISIAEDYAKRAGETGMEFSIATVRAYLNWRIGKEEEALEGVKKLIPDTARIEEPISDYVRDVGDIIFILMEMKKYDYAREVINNYENVARERENVYLKLKLAEYYMNYYRCVEDSEGYRDACVEHVEYYKEYLEVKRRDDLLALNLKIDLQRAEMEIKREKRRAERDALTSLKNRYALNVEAAEQLDRCADDKHSLLVGIVDVDYFKKFNDTYGHLCGDEVLKSVAEILKSVLKANGEIYRFGGDEFLVVAPDISEKDAEYIALEIKQEISVLEVDDASGEPIPMISVSQGYSYSYPKGNDTLEDYLKIADESLYYVKEQGRNSFYIHYQ